MRCVILASAFGVCLLPSPLSAADVCTKLTCEYAVGSSSERVTFYLGADITGPQQYGNKLGDRTLKACTCAETVHIPTAEEIAAAQATLIKEALAAGFREATKQVLEDIRASHAKHELNVCEALAKSQSDTNVLLKAMQSLLEAARKEQSKIEPTGAR